jgi:hypothetical protein
MCIEHVGRLSNVVIDTDQDQIVSIHREPLIQLMLPNAIFADSGGLDTNGEGSQAN